MSPGTVDGQLNPKALGIKASEPAHRVVPDDLVIAPKGGHQDRLLQAFWWWGCDPGRGAGATRATIWDDHGIQHGGSQRWSTGVDAAGVL